jgi:hypothetical protein
MIISILGVAWLLTHYGQFIDIFNDILKKPKRIILIPKKILSCFMCSSFWVAVIVTSGNIPLAGFISIIAFIIDKYLISTPIKID